MKRQKDTLQWHILVITAIHNQPNLSLKNLSYMYCSLNRHILNDM